MNEKKLASRSLSALVFALGAGTAAHASEVRIQNLEISEESRISAEDYEKIVEAENALSSGKSWGGSASFIHSGNYASFIHSGNYANFIHSGNYADFIHAGNYAHFIHAGNYARVDGEAADAEIPVPMEPAN